MMTPAFVFAVAVPLRVLTLAQAVDTAQHNHPTLRQARATVEVAEARSDQARAPLLPQINGNASYQRTTANFVSRPSFVQGGTTTRPQTFDTFNFFNFGVTLNQYIWDFGLTTGRWQAAKTNAEAQQQTERANLRDVVLNVRTTYFNARALRALVRVARETLANQERHLAQIDAFVRVGTRPDIDLAQARTDRANAQVMLINAEGNYESGKAALNQAMGVIGPTDYDVEDATFEPVSGEALPTDELLVEAEKTRPDLAAFERQLKAQAITVRALKGAYGPSLSASSSFTAAGTALDSLAWNWNVTANLSWSLFNGLLTPSQIKEAQANMSVLMAQRDALRLAIRLEVEQARLGVRAARAALVAADEAALNARERLRLAEGRYQAGVGNAIELGDAQVALTNAEAQRIQADYSIATARARLLKALGRR